MLVGQRLQGVGGQGVGIEAVPQRRLDAVIVAVGVGAGLRVCIRGAPASRFCLWQSESRCAASNQGLLRAAESVHFLLPRGSCPGRQVKNRPAFPTAFSAGNSTLIVLPIPVGAWQSSWPPSVQVLYTAFIIAR